MKRLFLFLIATLVAPAFAAPKLPPSIRAVMPRGAVTLKVFRLGPAPGAPRLIAHLWTTPRRNPGSDVPLESPFVVDVFTDQIKPEYQASLIYSGEKMPKRITLRFLNSQTKEGLVFEVDETIDFAPHSHFFVFQDDLESRVRSEEFIGIGGPSRGDLFYTPFRGADGTLEIERFQRYPGTPSTTKILQWNGEHFAEKK